MAKPKAKPVRNKPPQDKVVGIATSIKYLRKRGGNWRKWRVVVALSAAIFIAGALGNTLGIFDRIKNLVDPGSRSADKQDVASILERLDKLGGKRDAIGSYQIDAELNDELQSFLGTDSTPYKLVAEKLRGGDFTAATELLERFAQADLSASPPRKGAGVDKLYLAGLLQSRLDYAQSARLLEQAMRIDPNRGDVRATLAIVRINQGRTPDASGLLQGTSGNAETELMLANAAGLVALRNHDLTQAAAKFRWVLDQARATGSKSNEAAALGNLGSVYSNGGDLKTGAAYFDMSIAANRGRLPDLDGNQYCNLGKTAFQSGNVAGAENYFTLAIDVFRYTSKRDCLPNALIGLGVVRIDQRRFNDADVLLRRALALSRQLNDADGQVVALIDLATVMEARGAAARRVLREALAVAISQPADSDVFDRQSAIVERFLLDGVPANRAELRDLTETLLPGLERVNDPSPAYEKIALSLAMVTCARGDPMLYKQIMDTVLDQSRKLHDLYMVKMLFVGSIRVQRRYRVTCIFDTEKMDLSWIKG